MSSDSMPSKPVHFFDVPEVKNLEAEYRYNFFVSDESIDESGNEALNGNLSSRFLRKGAADDSNLNARIPRFVKLDFGFADTKKPILAAKNSRKKHFSMTSEQILSALNAGKIVTEDDAAEGRFKSLSLGNRSIETNLENLMRVTLNRYMGDESSVHDAVKKFSVRTEVNSNFISKSMVPPTLNEKPEKKQNPKQYSEQKKVRSRLQINSSYAPMVMRKSVERGTSLYDRGLLDNFLMSLDGYVIPKEFDVTDDENIFDVPVMDQERASSSRFVSQAAVVGVIVEKCRVYKGVKYPMPTVVVAGSQPNAGYDSQVAYGQTYEYVARTVAKFRVPATTEDGRTYVQTFLVASKPSQKAVVTLVEDRAPDPPQDVNFYYEYGTGHLYITWAPPVNPQRDVKYFQIFRRKSVKDAFELIANMDFDDSVIRSPLQEAIDPDLTVSYPSMPTFYIDSGFDKDSSYIYSLVAVDARQISSAYSTQIKVGFDRKKNKLTKDFICYAGAPKQYPNWTLKQNFFVDSMKDSNHEKVNIYFNPEAYTLIRNNGEVIPTFFSTTADPLARYVFQFINTDRLLEQKFEVTIDDSNFRKDLALEEDLEEDDDE